MGRLPASNATKRLHGVRPYRLNSAEVPTVAGELAPPRWLSSEAVGYFTELITELAPAVVMIDRYAVAMLAEAFTDYAGARERVRAEPIITGANGEQRRNPASFLQESAAARIAAWSRELAMTPAARARLTKVGRPAEPAEDHTRRLLTDANP